MNTERDKFLTEAMGLCYPEWERHSEWDGVERNYFNVCKTCGRNEYIHNLKYPIIDFSTWEGFGKLWEWAKLQEWWCDLMDGFDHESYELDWIDPDKFTDAVYNLKKDK